MRNLMLVVDSPAGRCKICRNERRMQVAPVGLRAEWSRSAVLPCLHCSDWSALLVLLGGGR